MYALCNQPVKNYSARGPKPKILNPEHQAVRPLEFWKKNYTFQNGR